MPERASASLQKAIEQGLTICLDSNCLIFYFNGDQPWTENLRPVFEAKDRGKIRLVTSTVTLAEVLAKKEAYQQSQLLNTVQRYFDVVPVSSNIGVYAAGIRQNYGRVKTPDALEMATASEAGAFLLITNDEQLIDKSLDRCQALYLKNLAMDWLEDEFQACIDTSQSVVSLSRGSITLNLEIDLFVDSRNPLPSLQTSLPAADFPLLALKLSQLVTGSTAVVGIVEGVPGQDEQLIALRLLPAGRPWLMPKIPDWIGQFTGKSHTLHELEPAIFVENVANAVDSFNQSHKDRGKPERRTLFLMADVSLAEAVSAVEKMDGDHQMLPHHKRIETWRRYLAPFHPLSPLWVKENARLWRGEASNAHHLDIGHFHNFFSMAGNVLGERGVK